MMETGAVISNGNSFIACFTAGFSLREYEVEICLHWQRYSNVPQMFCFNLLFETLKFYFLYSTDKFIKLEQVEIILKIYKRQD